jgi:predicted dehydrogenase
MRVPRSPAPPRPALRRVLLTGALLAGFGAGAQTPSPPSPAAPARPPAPEPRPNADGGRQAPLRVAVARLTHSHVHGLLRRPARGDVEIVGIYEPDTAVARRYAEQYGLRRALFFGDLAAMLDRTRPGAVLAFGSIREHLGVVEAAAPRGVHVMVEKPLAMTLAHAERMAALARRHRVHLLTNYETTWYPSTHAAYDAVHRDSAVGPVRKVVVHDGHPGPKEIGVPPEFLAWLTDPAQNGGGALIDFGCYGANLITWLMRGAAPTAVTAVTQQIKPDVYPRVDDEATILLTYPRAQGVVQASWNWPVDRKDMEVYGRTGYALAPDGRTLRLRRGRADAEQVVTPADRPPALADPFAYLAAVVRGDVRVDDADLSALPNNLTVMRILDAAGRSAREGRTVPLR